MTLLLHSSYLQDCCRDWSWWHTQIRYSTGEKLSENLELWKNLWNCVLDVFFTKILDRIDLLLVEVWWALSAYLITLDYAMDVGQAHPLPNPHNKSFPIHPLFVFLDTDTVNSQRLPCPNLHSRENFIACKKHDKELINKRSYLGESLVFRQKWAIFKVHKSPLGKNSRRIKRIDCSFHYVCGKFAVVANGLVLLENVDDYIHFPQMFGNTAMRGRPRNKFSNMKCIPHS